MFKLLGLLLQRSYLGWGETRHPEGGVDQRNFSFQQHFHIVSRAPVNWRDSRFRYFHTNVDLSRQTWGFFFYLRTFLDLRYNYISENNHQNILEHLYGFYVEIVNSMLLCVHKRECVFVCSCPHSLLNLMLPLNYLCPFCFPSYWLNRPCCLVGGSRLCVFIKHTAST